MGYHHHHHHFEPAESLRGVYVLAIALNLLFVFAEAGLGWSCNSLGLLSDAGHNLSDVFSLLLALFALELAKVRPARNYTYGYKKGTVLISLLNAIILLVAVGAIIVESIHKFGMTALVDNDLHAASNVARIFSDYKNDVNVLFAFGKRKSGAGIIVNGVSAWLLMRKRKSDLNAEGAFLHMAADTLVSIGVVVSGIAMSFTGWYIIDPVISLVIVGVILASTWHLLSQSLRLSLDGIPEGVDPERIMNEIKSVAGVEDIHHLHIWAISTSEVAMTAHVVIDDIAKMEQIKHEIHHRMSQDGISHSTLEFEHHGEMCDSPGNGWTSC